MQSLYSLWRPSASETFIDLVLSKLKKEKEREGVKVAPTLFWFNTLSNSCQRRSQ